MHGVRSMTAPLERVLMSEPADGDFGTAGWRAPDLHQLRRDHAALVGVIRGLGVGDVAVLPAADGLVDGCFTYDPVLVSGGGFVELQMAKPVRRPEPARLAEALTEMGVPRLGALEGDAVADAGDMFWLDTETLAVARGYRTNAAAHEQLAALLAPEGVTVERFDLPNHRGPEHLLHLLSVVSPLAEDLAVVFEPLMPVSLIEALDERGIRRVQCQPDEFELQGCNVLAVRPGVVVMADSCPLTRRAIEQSGCEVHVYPAGELNKGDGGPTCLTRPIYRGQV
jgi:N-dimethylarginine dimethylaminohydrolase